MPGNPLVLVLPGWTGRLRTLVVAVPEGLLGGMLLCFKGCPVREAALEQHRCGRSIAPVKHVRVQGRQLDGGMQGRCGGPAHKQGQVHSPAGHLPANLLHLEEAGGDEPAYGYGIGLLLEGAVQDGIPVHHYPQVHDVKAVAAQHNAGDVLSYVVDISLYGGHDHFGPAAGLFRSLKMRFQHAHGLAHHLGALDHLRQEHLAFSKSSSHFFHGIHQRAFNHLYGAAQPAQLFQYGFGEAFASALQKAGSDAFSGRGRAQL